MESVEPKGKPDGAHGPASVADGPAEAPADAARRVYLYDGFISYPHSERDLKITRILQHALHGFAKPWYRMRAVRLYRDETNLGARPDLWGTIEAALDQSRFLLLIASPDAAKSFWVNREVAHWLETKGQSSILIVLTHGRLVWDKETGRLDRDTTNSLPPSALAGLSAEPLWVDLTWFADDKNDEQAQLLPFRDAVASISATLRGVDKDAITGEDVRQRKRTMRLAGMVIAGLALLTAASLAGGAIAIREAEQARREQARATTWAERRLFTTSLVLSQKVEETRDFNSVTLDDGEGLTFGMYLGWSQSSGRLEVLMKAMRDKDQSHFDEIFSDGDAQKSAGLINFLQRPNGGFVRSYGSSDPKYDLSTDAWQARFRAAGDFVPFQQVQIDHALADFEVDRRMVEIEMPMIRTERGVAFMVDVTVQEGVRAARNMYTKAAAEHADEAAIMDEVARLSVLRFNKFPSFQKPVQRRRDLFRTTPLLLDELLDSAGEPPPAFIKDVMTWADRLAGAWVERTAVALRLAPRPGARPTAQTAPAIQQQLNPEPVGPKAWSREDAIQEIRRTLEASLAKPEAELTRSADIVKDLGATSSDLIEITGFLEKSFDVSLPKDFLVENPTIDRIAASVCDLMKTRCQ